MLYLQIYERCILDIIQAWDLGVAMIEINRYSCDDSNKDEFYHHNLCCKNFKLKK